MHNNVEKYILFSVALPNIGYFLFDNCCISQKYLHALLCELAVKHIYAPLMVFLNRYNGLHFLKTRGFQ